jgi:hypothetical protein
LTGRRSNLFFYSIMSLCHRSPRLCHCEPYPLDGLTTQSLSLYSAITSPVPVLSLVSPASLHPSPLSHSVAVRHSPKPPAPYSSSKRKCPTYLPFSDNSYPATYPLPFVKIPDYLLHLYMTPTFKLNRGYIPILT